MSSLRRKPPQSKSSSVIDSAQTAMSASRQKARQSKSSSVIDSAQTTMSDPRRKPRHSKLSYLIESAQAAMSDPIRKPPPDDEVLYWGEVKWVPGDDTDCFVDEIYYVTKQYYDDGKVKVGNSKVKGRWVCIVKHAKRYCGFCHKDGDHTTINCPTYREKPSSSTEGGWTDWRYNLKCDLKCEICLEVGHLYSRCPCSEYLPKGATVSDACEILCRDCGAVDGHPDGEWVPPDGDWVRTAHIKECDICGDKGHIDDTCPMLKS